MDDNAHMLCMLMLQYTGNAGGGADLGEIIKLLCSPYVRVVNRKECWLWDMKSRLWQPGSGPNVTSGMHRCLIEGVEKAHDAVKKLQMELADWMPHQFTQKEADAMKNIIGAVCPYLQPDHNMSLAPSNRQEWLDAIGITTTTTTTTTTRKKRKRVDTDNTPPPLVQSFFSWASRYFFDDKDQFHENKLFTQLIKYDTTLDLDQSIRKVISTFKETRKLREAWTSVSRDVMAANQFNAPCNSASLPLPRGMVVEITPSGSYHVRLRELSDRCLFVNEVDSCNADDKFNAGWQKTLATLTGGCSIKERYLQLLVGSMVVSRGDHSDRETKCCLLKSEDEAQLAALHQLSNLIRTCFGLSMVTELDQSLVCQKQMGIRSHSSHAGGELGARSAATTKINRMMGCRAVLIKIDAQEWLCFHDQLERLCAKTKIFNQMYCEEAVSFDSDMQFVVISKRFPCKAKHLDFDKRHLKKLYLVPLDEPWKEQEQQQQQADQPYNDSNFNAFFNWVASGSIRFIKGQRQDSLHCLQSIQEQYYTSHHHHPIICAKQDPLSNLQ